MPTVRKLLLLVATAAAMSAETAPAQAPGHVTGVGGVFLRSPDPKALTAWYRDVLGIAVESWGGIIFRAEAPGHPPVLTLNAFGPKSDQFAPSTRDVMLNFAVDDLPAMVARLKAKGVPILKEDNSDPYGKFAWIMDPDGTKIELWQPK